MGQKVSPTGLRVGINKDWESKWYAEKDYAKYLHEDIKIRKLLNNKLQEAIISKILIEKTKDSITINIHAARQGVVIGQDGKNVKELEKQIKKIVGDRDVKINVSKVENPDLDAKVVARSIAAQLEARASFRIAQKKAIQRVMRAGAKGVKTLVSGRLNGADMARSEGYSEGVVPLHTLRSDIDYATSEAHTTYGRLGVKVWICRGEILPEKKKDKNEEKGE
ncbi:TPA: 30S ribosomal protein S3 [bacterium]|nr:30S ribosomal protein S3 [bacterium]